MTAPAIFTGGEAVRLVPILSDHMEPTLRRGDFAMVAPVDAYNFDGIYVFDFGDGEDALYRCERAVGSPTMRVWSDNPAYTRQEWPLDFFGQHVRGKVVAEILVRDSRLLQVAYAEAA